MPIRASLDWIWPRKKTSGRRTPASLTDSGPVSASASAFERRIERPRANLPRFQTSAADHVDRERNDLRSRERVKLRNSFTPSQPVVDPQMFAGRRQVLQNLIRSVEDQKSHIVVYGDRGVGKTSLLRMLAKAAAEAKYIVVYFSCGATSDFTETFRAVAAEIPLLYHSGISPMSAEQEVGRTLLDLLGSGKLTPRLVGDAAARIVGTRVLVILDEFDRSESPEFRRDVAELIKTLSDVSARLQLVIGGVAGDLVDLMEYIPSIRRSVAALRLGAMSDEEVRDLIENGSRASTVRFEPEAVELIVSAARGSPYLTSFMCHVSGMHALDAGRLRVDMDDVRTGLDDLIEDFRSRIPMQLAQHLDEVAKSLEGARTPREAGEDKTPAAKRGHEGFSNASARILEKLEKQGALDGVKPSAYALMLDSVAPYLELKSARERLLAKAA